MLTTAEEEKSLRCCLVKEDILPVVLVDIVVGFFKWDWPRVGEEVAAIDSGGSWWRAVVLGRTFDTANVHYLGWLSFYDERHSRRPVRHANPHYGTAIYKAMLANAQHDSAKKIIWPTLRNPDCFINCVGGSWKRYPIWPQLNNTNPEGKMIWRPDPSFGFV